MTKAEIKSLIPVTPFSPLDISSLVGWYDFTDPSQLTIVSGLVSAVNDKSAANNDLAQATSGNRPSYTTYGGQRDFGFASFVSGKTLAKSVTYSQPYTVSMVIKLKSWAHQATFLRLASGTSGAIQTYGTAVGTYTANGIGVVMGSNWMLWKRSQYVDNQTVIMTFVVNDTVCKQAMSGVYFDDVPSTTNSDGSSGAGTNGITTIQIGDATASPNFDIYELLYFNGALNETECLKVDKYLNDKYNIQKVPVIVNFGDSITSNMSGYAAMVSKEMEWQSYNLGIAGTTIATNLRPIVGKYLTKIPKDAYISISFGTNDSPVDADWNTSMIAVVENILSYGFNPKKILLVTPPYSSTRVAKLTSIQGYFSAIATKYGLTYVDCVTTTLAGGGDALLSDGAHPTEAGHEVIKDTIIDAL